MSTNLSSHLSKFGIMFMLSNRLNRSCLSDDENRGAKLLSCLSRVVLVPLPVVMCNVLLICCNCICYNCQTFPVLHVFGFFSSPIVVSLCVLLIRLLDLCETQIAGRNIIIYIC